MTKLLNDTKLYVTQNDISQDFANHIKKSGYVAIDIETSGLRWKTDKLNTVQLYSENIAFIYQHKGKIPNQLIKTLKDPSIKKIFHHAMFDLRFIFKTWNIKFENIVCTKITSKIIRENKSSHSLKPLLLEYLNIEIEKDQHLSDWNRDNLSKEQIRYALNDVIYLKSLFNSLEKNATDNQLKLVDNCFLFVPTLVSLQLLGIEKVFEH